MLRRWFWVLLLTVLLASCQQPKDNSFRVRVIADGKEMVYSAEEHVSVIQFLQKINLHVDPLDRIYPSDFTQIADNMLITIVRVRERTECVDETLPYETKFINSPDLAPGTTKVAQAGVNGTQRICYTIQEEDGVEKSRTAGNPTILTQPTTEIIYRGIDKAKIEPVPVVGMLMYISDGQARVIEGNSLNDRVLPTGGNLDGQVFALSTDGKQLLFTRRPEGTPTPETFNQLWVLLNTADPQAKPVRIKEIDNVLTAEWRPDQPFTFSYSTLQPRAGTPPYQALNDLNTARLDSRTGKLLKATPEVKSRPTGVYSLWGTTFKWSPDGKNMAWAQADGAGIVDFKAGTFKKLFDFKVYSTTLSRNWVWMPSLTWSPDSSLLAATVHGKPLGGEQEEFSPVFNVALVQAAGQFQIDLVPQAGMWAAPQYSPLINAGTDAAQGYIAYLKARTPIDSVSSEYDLVVADRDGSNPRVVFPGKDKPGIKPIDTPFGNEIVWNPEGRQVALVYLGDVWIVDVEANRANQVTLINNAHHVRWIK